MRVLYDGIVFQNSYQRGIQRAFREMIGHMPAGVDMTLALSDRPKCELPGKPRIVRTTPRILGCMHRRIRKTLAPRLSAPRKHVSRSVMKRCEAAAAPPPATPSRFEPPSLGALRRCSRRSAPDPRTCCVA